MPLLWSVDRLSAMPVLQPLAGGCLLMLMLGWPLAVLMLVPVAAATMLLGGLRRAEALDRGVWLGVVPVTLAMLFGAGLRRWLPHHLFVYILGRGFFATALAVAAAGALAAGLQVAPAGLSDGDLLLARWLFAWGDAFLTGMLVAIFVAFRPEWLATYADRIYLPRPDPRQAHNRSLVDDCGPRSTLDGLVGPTQARSPKVTAALTLGALGASTATSAPARFTR